MAASTPSERSLRARGAVLAAHAKHGPEKMTEKARAAAPSSDAYWVERARQLLPDLTDPDELARRADFLKRSYFAQLGARRARLARQKRNAEE